MKRLMILSLGVALLAGCAETRGTRVTIDTETGEASVLENSYRLSNRVKVRKVTYGDASEGIRRATVTLESVTKRRQRIQARMVWTDAEGTEIDADAKPYRTLVLDGGDVTTFTGVAPNAKAVRAKLQVREIKTVE
jgi:uncharacterized protein YcfL